jgi:hypothetical protein
MLSELMKSGLIEYNLDEEQKIVNIKSTILGITMAKNYIALETMKNIFVSETRLFSFLVFELF